MTIEGELAGDVLTYTSVKPYEAKFPGLWSWNSDGVFAKVRIYTGAP